MKRYKRRIKESDANVYFSASIDTDVYEDSYSSGEGKHVNNFTEEITRIKDLKTLLKEIADYVGAPKPTDLSYDNMNNYSWASELWYDTLVDVDNYPVSQKSEDYKLWKQGKIVLYNQRHHILISRVGKSPVGIKELNKVGIR